MLSKRKLLLNKKDEDEDDDIESITIDDEEINSVFKLNEKSKLNRNKGLKFYESCRNKNFLGKPGKLINEKPKDQENNVQIKLNSSITLHSTEDVICIDSDDSTELKIGNSTYLNQIKSTVKNNSLIENLDNSNEEILISSNSNSPTKLNLADSSFDQFQFDSIMPAGFKFVKKINVKFRYKGEYKCVQFNSNDKFKDKLDDISAKLLIDISKLIFMFNEKTISFEETPESLGICITDIIDVFEKKEDEKLVDEDPNLFKLKFRDCESRKRVQDVLLTMNRYDNFTHVFNKYAELKGVNVNNILFEFDGERMTADQKPDDLDMESDSLIDVKIKN